MKILFSGGVSLRYKERVTKKKKYRSFKEFVDFKKKVDRIFKEYDIKLKTIPQDPTPTHRRKGGYAFIISERLANVFKNRNFTGYTLEPVVHVGRKEEREKHYQMIITNKLPPISDKMPTLEDDINMEEKYRCKDCAKAVIKFPLHYDRSSLNNICDFNVAYEETVYPDFQPRVLVSPRVKELFNLLRIKPAYKPIIVVD